MNIDPSTNLVVFEIKGYAEPVLVSGQTRDEQCVQRAWMSAPVHHRSDARKVTRVYCEWQPSAVDDEFIGRTFPIASVTYSFSRPGPDGWDAAFAAAREAMVKAAEERGAAQAAENMDHVSATGELIPLLWSASSARVDMLRHIPHRELVAGLLFAGLATVAMTPNGRLGMNHVTEAGLGDGSFDDAYAEAARNLVDGLRVEAHNDRSRPEKGTLMVMRRELSFASSAVALPDFHRQMAAALDDDRLVVGLPDPDTVLVAAAGSPWAYDVEQMVLESPGLDSELVPCVLVFEPDGIRMVAERS